MMANTTNAFPDASDSAPLTQEDRRILAQVDESLAAGVEVYRWWKKTDAARSYREQFELERTFNPAQRSIAFFDDAPLSMGSTPVLGVVQEMTFDFSRRDPQDARDQIREFVMRYLLRVSDYQRPAAFMIRNFQRTAEQEAQLDGWGYSQVYYKLREGGAVGKFAESAQARIVDLRELGKTYEWIVLQAKLFNLAFDLSPLGDSYPHFVVPTAAFTEEFLVISADLVVNEEEPEPGVLGRYGGGIATLRDLSLQRGPLLWGPGRFFPGFSSFVFEVRSSGETIVTSPFAVNRPERVFGLDPDPVAIGTRLADAMSFGLASRLLPDLTHGIDPLLSPIAVFNRATGNLPATSLGISKETVERFLMVQHFMAVYEMLAGAALTYCRVPDWTAPENKLPRWVQEGLVH